MFDFEFFLVFYYVLTSNFEVLLTAIFYLLKALSHGFILSIS